MAKNVTIAGASYTAVPSIDLPITGGGTASFIDPEDAEAALGSDGTEDLDVAIEALTTYANTVTGESDTTLSEAVATLASGYGGGGYSIDDFNDKTISGAITLTGTSIREYVFYGCTGITSVTASQATTIGSYAFYGCTGITSGDFSSATTIDSNAFQNASIKGCSFNPTTINNSAFRSVKYCGIEILPNVTKISGQYSLAGTYASGNNTESNVIVLPSLTSITSTYNLSYNDSLYIVDLGPLTSIPALTFRGTSALTTLILRNSSVTTLANVNAFTSTPFASGGSGGTIYVPSDLISSYQSSSNWRTIDGYGTVTWTAIEGSIYETQYADGTAIS